MVWHAGNPLCGLANRHFNHMPHMQPGNFHSKGFLAQPVATTGTTGPVVLIAFEFFADPIRVGLAVAALHVRDDALKGAGHLVNTPALIISERDFFLARPVEEHLLDVGRQVFPARIAIKLVMSGNGLDGLQEIRGFPFPPRSERPISDLERCIGDNQPFIKEQLDAKAIAFRAGPKGCIERKQARLNLRDREARYRAGKVL